MKNNNDVIFTKDDYEFILNDDPMDPDNMLFGLDPINPDSTENDPMDFMIERVNDTIEALKIYLSSFDTVAIKFLSSNSK